MSKNNEKSDIKDFKLKLAIAKQNYKYLIHSYIIKDWPKLISFIMY